MCNHNRIVGHTSKNEPVCGDCGQVLLTLDQIRDRSLAYVERLAIEQRITEQTFIEYVTLWRNSTFRFSDLYKEYET